MFSEGLHHNRDGLMLNIRFKISRFKESFKFTIVMSTEAFKARMRHRPYISQEDKPQRALSSTMFFPDTHP